MVEIIVQIVCDKQVEVAVAVIIGSRGRRRPARVAHSGTGGRVAKCSVTVVEEEHIGAVVAKIKIGKAVVVEIGGESSLAPEFVYYS